MQCYRWPHRLSPGAGLRRDSPRQADQTVDADADGREVKRRSPGQKSSRADLENRGGS